MSLVYMKKIESEVAYRRVAQFIIVKSAGFPPHVLFPPTLIDIAIRSIWYKVSFIFLQWCVRMVT